LYPVSPAVAHDGSSVKLVHTPLTQTSGDAQVAFICAEFSTQVPFSGTEEPPHILVLVLPVTAWQVRPSQQVLGYVCGNCVSSHTSPPLAEHWKAVVVVVSVDPVPVVVEVVVQDPHTPLQHVPLEQ